MRHDAREGKLTPSLKEFVRQIDLGLYPKW
jgi:hypothetical protein